MDGLIDEVDKIINWKLIVFVDEDVFLDLEDEELGYLEFVFYYFVLI